MKDNSVLFENNRKEIKYNVKVHYGYIGIIKYKDIIYPQY